MIKVTDPVLAILRLVNVFPLMVQFSGVPVAAVIKVSNPEPTCVTFWKLLVLMVNEVVLLAAVLEMKVRTFDVEPVVFAPLKALPVIFVATVEDTVFTIPNMVPVAAVDTILVTVLFVMFKVPVPAKPLRIHATSEVEVLAVVKLLIVLPFTFMVAGADWSQIAVSATVELVDLVMLMVLLLMLIVLPDAFPD